MKYPERLTVKFFYAANTVAVCLGKVRVGGEGGLGGEEGWGGGGLGAKGKVVCFKIDVDLTKFIILLSLFLIEACLKAYCSV